MRVKIGPGLYVDAPLDSLEALRAAWAANPLLNYYPQEPQRLFHEAVGFRTPIVAFFGGNQSGKTHCSIADDIIQALSADAVPEHLLPYKRWQPPFHAWICCPKNKKLSEAIFPKIRELVPPSELYRGSFDEALHKNDATLRFANGSTFGFKTYDQDVDAYSSATLHRIHWDEEPPGEHGFEIRKEARARLLKHGGDEILSMTPLLGLSWVYEKIYEPFERGDKRIFCVRADLDDNKYIDATYKAQFLADLTKEEIEARKEGKFVHFRGLVYPEYDERQHVVEPPSIKHVRGLESVVGIDPGARTTAVSFNGFDRDNSMLTYDELYLHDEDAIPENAAKFIRAKLTAWGVKDPLFVIDPSARNRNLVTGENVQNAYARAGIPVLPGQAEKLAGVFEVRRRLQATPRPLWLVSRDCTVTQWEIGRYRMDDRADGKFEVVKENDHIMDTIRYVAMVRPLRFPDPAKDPSVYSHKPGVAPSIDVMLSPRPSMDWDL